MFTTIVWGTDGSEAADRALEYAKELATSSGTRLFGVHVDERFTGGRSTGAPVLADEDELRSRARGQIETARTEGFDASFDILHCTAGRTAHALAEFAESVDADVIVIGTHGHSPLTGALLGSVAQGLLHRAPCPVLAVPPVHALVHA